MVKVPQTKEELKKHLEEQIRFLKKSAEDFDKGNKAESKRIAHTIRLLLHDTSSSKSLLGQLQLKSIHFLDTSYDVEDTSCLSKFGLVMMALSQGEFKPRCITPPKPWGEPRELKSFEDWWNKIVIIDSENNHFTRKDLILGLANKDGGSHVDPELDEAYNKLTRQNSIGWKCRINKGLERGIEAIELASVRQIAYEVLESLERNKTNSKEKE